MTTARLRSAASTLLAGAVLLSLNACAVDGDPAFGTDQGAIEQQAVCELGEREPCAQDSGEGGEAECILDENGEAAWTECALPTCGDGYAWNGTCCAHEIFSCCDYEECNTPLVLSFDDGAVQYTSSTEQSSFSLTRSGSSQVTDWPTAATPWLAIDTNENGRIDDASELFGDATTLTKGYAKNGFEALAQHDDDGDGYITPKDAVWSKLVVWADDGDRQTQARELTMATTRELLWIALDYRMELRCDARGNCEGERASFAYVDAQGVPQMGAVIDVRLPDQG